jgi:hypothetical protein
MYRALIVEVYGMFTGGSDATTLYGVEIEATTQALRAARLMSPMCETR